MADKVNFGAAEREGSLGCLEERLDQLEAAIKKPSPGRILTSFRTPSWRFWRA